MSDNLESSLPRSISSLVEVDEGETVTSEYGPSLQYHERFLYDLFGKEAANSFLHPTIDSSIGVAGMAANIKSVKKNRSGNKKKPAVSYDQTLAKLAVNAERLWSMLRENSSSNIKNEDKKIARELKETFDAFARSCINKNMTPPERGFVENKEINEMTKIMKNRKIDKLNLDRRKKQLMYNLSRVQEGNQIILMKEKSFLGNDELHCSDKELFFPPLISNQNERLTDDLHEKKPRIQYHKVLSDLQVDIINERALFDKRQSTPPVGLKFFTEEDSLKILHDKGQFQQYMKYKTNQKDGVMENIIEKSRKWVEDDKIKSEESFDYLVPASHKSDFRLKHQSIGNITETDQSPKQWQPLTLGALVDFKVSRRPTFIEDQEFSFRQGAVKLWRPKLAQV